MIRFSNFISEGADATLADKAKKSGFSLGILKQVYKRGMAAWKVGHKPGTTPQQWGMARVNSFITGGRTRVKGDPDLWAKQKGKIKKPKKEDIDEGSLNELTPAQKQMKMKAQGGIRGREGGGAAKDHRDAGMGNIDHQSRGLKKTHKPGDVSTGYSGDYRTAQARKKDAETGKIASIAMNKALRKKDPKVGADSRLSDLRRKHAAKIGRDMQGNKVKELSTRREDSDAVKAFLAKGGKIKKLPPGKAAGYHGKDDPGKGMHGMMDKPDTKGFKKNKFVGSMK